MKTVHIISIVVGLIAIAFGIIASIIKGSFHEYYQLVFIGTILATLGIMNRKGVDL